MPDSLSIHEPSFLNTAGHAAGLLIFGYLFLLMFTELRSRRSSRPRLPAAAALLGLVWNGGALVILLLDQPNALWTHVISAVSFAALSLLPAVLLSIAMEGTGSRFVTAGYAASGAAVCLHLAETVLLNPELHRWGLLLITAVFGALTVAATVSGFRRTQQRNATRVLAPMALLLFAISFVHFGDEHAGTVWIGEIAFHHAGIPLALFIVLQDYRFLLLDAFVRALAGVVLATMIIFALVFSSELSGIQDLPSQSPAVRALTLMFIPLSLVLFAALMNRLQEWLTRNVFRRPDLATAVGRLMNRPGPEATEEHLLVLAGDVIAAHAGAQRHELLTEVPPQWQSLVYPHLIGPHAAEPGFAWAEVVVPVRLARGESRLLLLARRLGGRRYLSEDLHDLSHLAIAAAGQVERFRAERGEQLAAEAEFRALQSQINPHFLFNSLNALYGAIPRTAAAARKNVLNLADIFRYVLQSERQRIALADEIHIVKAYLEIEQLRLGDRLQVEVDVDPDAMEVAIPSLSIQPLVENAVKHGVARRSGPGRVSLRIRRTPEFIEVAVEDTGGLDIAGGEADGAGVGLENVRQRLRLLYGSSTTLHFASTDKGTLVSVAIPLPEAARENANAYADR